MNSLLETGEGEERTLSGSGRSAPACFRVKRRARDAVRAGRRPLEPIRDEPRRDARSREGRRSCGPAPATRVSSASRGDSFEPVLLGTPTREIYSLAGGVGVDAETLWVGTRVSGLLRVQEAPWAALDLASGLPGDQVFCFLEEAGPGGREAIWIGTNAGAAVLEDGRVEAHGPETGLPAAQVRSLASSRDGGGGRAVWASVVGSGLHRFDGRRWSAVDAGPAFRSDDAVGPPRRRRRKRNRRSSGSGRRSRASAGSPTDAGASLGVAQGLPSDSVLSLLVDARRGRHGRSGSARGAAGSRRSSADRVVAVHDRGSGLPNNNILSLAEVHRPERPA